MDYQFAIMFPVLVVGVIGGCALIVKIVNKVME